MGKIHGQHRGRRVGAHVAADDRRAIHPRFGMNRQQAAQSGLYQTRRRALALGQFNFRDRSVWRLPNRIHALAKKKISHGGIAHHYHLVNGLWIDRELLDRVGQVAGQRAQQQSSRVIRVVSDARHHLRAAETLRILKRSVRNQLAALEVEQAQNDRRRPKVHSEPMDRPGRAFHLSSIYKDAATVACHCRIELERGADGQTECVALDAHAPPPHGMAANLPAGAGHKCLAR